MRRTKIVCTIGPNSLSPSTLLSLFESGMNIVRLNGSHSDLEWHKNAIALIQNTLPDIPILLDIPGRKIRTGRLAKEPKFETGDKLIFTTNEKFEDFDKIPINYQYLHQDLSVGNIIMADDGSLKFRVEKITDSDIHVVAENSGILKSAKGINVPFVDLKTPEISEKDSHLVNFACENRVNYIGISFVESKNHLLGFRKLIGDRSLRLIAKIENQGGLNNLEEIIEETDGIMIDRGDLSVETSMYDIALKQKLIIKTSVKFGKPVIVATEMLHSMINNPYPTKSEICDISNAVIDGCSATMLSGETAIGDYPIEAVSTMRQVIEATEKYQQEYTETQNHQFDQNLAGVISEVIDILSRNTSITKVVAVTRFGHVAKMISRFRIGKPLLAVSDDFMAAKSFNLIPGALGVHFPAPFSTSNSDHFLGVLKYLYEKKMILRNDFVLITGITNPIKGSRANTIQLFKIEDLEKEYNW